MLRKTKFSVVLAFLLVFLMSFNVFALTTVETTVNNLSDLEKQIVLNMTNRVNNFRIVYTGDTNELMAKLQDTFVLAYSSDDYLRWSWKTYKISLSGVVGKVNIDFNIAYHTTKKQEDYVDKEVDRILSEIIKDNMSDYEKIVAIFNYIRENTSYDNTLTRFSAYDALNGSAVCQGYTLLGYKMLRKVGIENRIATGVLKGEAHSWNIVKLDGQEYHLDITNNILLAGDNTLIQKGIKIDQQFVLNNNDYKAPVTKGEEKEETKEETKKETKEDVKEESKEKIKEEVDPRWILWAEHHVNRFKTQRTPERLRTAMHYVDRLPQSYKTPFEKEIKEVFYNIYQKTTDLRYFESLIVVLPEGEIREYAQGLYDERLKEAEFNFLNFVVRQYRLHREERLYNNALTHVNNARFEENKVHFLQILESLRR